MADRSNPNSSQAINNKKSPSTWRMPDEKTDDII